MLDCLICGEFFETSKRASFCPTCLPHVLSVKAQMKRERYKAAGLCSKCGNREAEPGFLYCRRCRSSHQEAQRRYADKGAADGIMKIALREKSDKSCARCSEEALPGLLLCETHRRQNAAAVKALYDNRKKAGVCTRCAGVLDGNSSILCVGCSAKKSSHKKRLRLASLALS